MPAKTLLAVAVGVGGILALAAVVSGPWRSASGPASPGLRDGKALPERPNVLFVMVDTLRRDRVGLYGQPRDLTPNLDAFFAEGTTFTHATSPSPCTRPAVKQVLTGRRDFADRRPRLAELLAGHGYATAAVVSQHFFRTPRGPKPAYRRGFAHFDVQSGAQQDRYGMTTRIAEEVSDRAIAWLDANTGAEPFFLWLHYFDPHDPYEAPSEYRTFPAPDPSLGGDRRRYLRAAMEEALARADAAGKEAISARRNPSAYFGSVFTAEQVETFRSYYDAEVAYTDAQIGRVLAHLEALDLVGTTLVILTADHGERLGEDDRWGHCQSLHGYEIDVPLLVSHRAPGGLARVPHAVSTLDVAPTVLKRAGVPLDLSAFDGADLLELDEDRLLYATWRRERWAVQSSEWKLRIPGPGEPPALFHIAHDPDETRDLAGSEPARFERMLAALGQETRRSRGVEDQIEEELDQMRAIGYLE